jgi:hypothetical protein
MRNRGSAGLKICYRAKLEHASTGLNHARRSSSCSSISFGEPASWPDNKALKTKVWRMFSAEKSGQLMDLQGKECYIQW